MNRPPAVHGVFAGHAVPRTKAAFDQIREYIEHLEAKQCVFDNRPGDCGRVVVRRNPRGTTHCDQ